MKTLVAVLVIILLAAAALLFKMNGRYAATVAEVAAVRAENARLTARLAEAEAGLVDAAELERMKSDQRDAIKLRGELTNLRQQLTNAAAGARSAQQAADRASANAARAQAQQQQAAEAQLVEPRTFSTQVATVMPVGQSLVMGGWPTGTNTVTYAFITPTTAQPGADTVTIDAKFVELPQELAAGLGSMLGQGNDQLRITPQRMSEMLTAWQQTPGVNVLGSPRLTTLSGRQGTVSVGQSRQTANGPVHFGPEVSILPTLGPDGTQVQLNITAKLTTSAPTAQP